MAGGTGTSRGSGGMASKLAAAKIAAWSGVEAVIASASREGVLSAAVAGEKGIGTVVRPKSRRLPARKLWIAFAVGASGTRSEEHTSELQSLMRISYAVFCLKKQKKHTQ